MNSYLVIKTEIVEYLDDIIYKQFGIHRNSSEQKVLLFYRTILFLYLFS
jgi:hypothetical protein